MIFFIFCLRALAACLITNAHYTHIYPLEIIANGGLLGDVIFFAVSGYCLSHVKLKFSKWYGKRLLRCYVPVLIATLVYFMVGAYTTEEYSLFWWFVYPTGYHFIASIVVLYIPFYFLMKYFGTEKKLLLSLGILATVQLCVYLIFYDKSFYHIDNVRQPMIRLLFFGAMILGALFRRKDARIRGHFSKLSAIGTAFFAGLYFASKMLFSKGMLPYSLQILNQYILFGFLFCVFRLFAGLDNSLNRLPLWGKKVISFLSDRTLEIYVVQYAIIDWLRPVGSFPLNWLLITVSIVLGATVLHWICGAVFRFLKISDRNKD